MLRTLVLSALVLVLAAGCNGSSRPSMDSVLDAVGVGSGGGGLDTATIIAGLKEALEVGTRNAVRSTSAPNGFLGNSLIKIATPSELSTMTRTLRKVGLGGEVDKFETALNRAAERASAEATAVFLDAVRQMTIADARGILQGGDTAATRYFERVTTMPLTARFTPIVNAKMNEVGLNRIYQGMKNRYNAIPLVPRLEFDLTQYVVKETLDGLFTVVGQEETKIRRDPGARVTDLLRQVFSSNP